MRKFFLIIITAALSLQLHAQTGTPTGSPVHVPVKRLHDVIYDHRAGVALVMDVLIPEKQNGMAVFRLISGGWRSDKVTSWYPMDSQPLTEYTDRGFTVFLVAHGEAPRFTALEIVTQIQRAIQYARYNAKTFGIDANRFGITGGSSGGHLSICAGVFGKDAITEAAYRKEHSLPDGAAVDPVDLVSSKVQAVACLFPPTNLVDYGKTGSTYIDFENPNIVKLADAFGVSKATPRDQLIETFRQSSPYFFVTKETAPTLIIHGTADKEVPCSQSVQFIAKLKENKVPCKLITVEGGEHTWAINNEQAMIDWYEMYLGKNLNQ